MGKAGEAPPQPPTTPQLTAAAASSSATTKPPLTNIAPHGDWKNRTHDPLAMRFMSEIVCLTNQKKKKKSKSQQSTGQARRRKEKGLIFPGPRAPLSSPSVNIISKLLYLLFFIAPLILAFTVCLGSRMMGRRKKKKEKNMSPRCPRSSMRRPHLPRESESCPPIWLKAPRIPTFCMSDRRGNTGAVCTPHSTLKCAERSRAF